uniref:Uncharacterized protein n=1 Tax=Leersia perrieri TaxID=77586 RepID=A0A0D9XXU5_9ORYZ
MAEAMTTGAVNSNSVRRRNTKSSRRPASVLIPRGGALPEVELLNFLTAHRVMGWVMLAGKLTD